jgi:HlyD family secretion protein
MKSLWAAVRTRKAWWIGAAVLLAAALFFVLRPGGDDVRYATAPVERGDIADVVGATGTLQAVTTVQVGSQVSGTVSQLSADFNSRVTKNQIIARLDPSSFEARVGQAQANLVAARANVERQQATVVDARQKLARAQELSKEQLLPEADLETARSTALSAEAQLKANQAAVTQAVAAVNQAQVDLDHTIIRSPIDGIVVGRSVDVGQTVAASLQAPTLFVIAQDLTRMQVLASIDEADIGRVHTDQTATFHVDSFPDQTFEGRVEQVRLQPTTVQNVVTYNAIIAVDNPGQRLMPGMTATVSLVVRQRDDVLRIPAAALRFRPPEGAAPEGRPSAAAGTAQAAGQPSTARSPGGERPAGGGQGRRRLGGGDGSGGGSRGGQAGGAGAGERGRTATVYVPLSKDKLQPQQIRVGLSDGQYVEVLSGLEQGAQVVTGLETGARTAAGRPSASPSNNPFAPGRGQRRQR